MELRVLPDIETQGDSGEKSPMWPHDRWHGRDCTLAARAVARSWISSHRNDPDLREDVRMMVPLFKDVERDEFHVLAVAGYEQSNLKVSFVERPDVSVQDGRGRAVEPCIDWSDATYSLARPVT